MNLIEVNNLSKKFCSDLKKSLLYGIQDTLRNATSRPPHSQLREKEFWALDGINFSIKGGEIVGILGENGSGKSTLLRLINGIFPPDKGHIKLYGKVGGLIAVGAGFHPHMSGRENIYVNGSLLGMKTMDIDRNLKSIIDFSELGEFVDAPLATYSSGMKVRLGFSIAIHSKPNIFLVDEALSVGDLNFRNKSLEKIMQYRSELSSILFVSHNLDQIRTLCTRCLVLNKSRLIFDGSTEEAITVYENLMLQKRESGVFIEKDEDYIDSVTLESLITDEFFDFKFNIHSKEDIEGEFFFNMGITSPLSQTPLVFTSSEFSENQFKLTRLVKGANTLNVRMPAIKLSAGSYGANFAIRDACSGKTYGRFFFTNQFIVQATKQNKTRGLLSTTTSWNLHSKEGKA